MGFGSEFARRNVIEKYVNRDPFWNPSDGVPEYELLNQVIVPSPQDIRNFQIQKIKRFEEQSIDSRFVGLNSLATQSFNSVLQQFESKENESIDQAIEFLVTKFNHLYFTNKGEEKSQKDWEVIQTRLKALQKALQNLQSELAMNSMVMTETLQRVQRAIQGCSLNSLNVEEVNAFLSSVSKTKGALLEEIGVAYFKYLNIPAIESIRVGNVHLNTNRPSRHSGQLIQDLIVYNIDSPVLLKDTQVTYKPVGSDKDVTTSLGEMLEAIEKANGQNKSIIINDDTYDVLLELQSINIQAKSGKNQQPWNINKSTSFSINEFSDENDLFDLSIKRTFSLLSSLKLEDNLSGNWTIEDTSDDYNALANYGLATVLFKVLHLSKEGNQFLLTPYGFMSYSNRIAQLLQTENSIIAIQDKVSLSSAMHSSYSAVIQN